MLHRLLCARRRVSGLGRRRWASSVDLRVDDLDLEMDNGSIRNNLNHRSVDGRRKTVSAYLKSPSLISDCAVIVAYRFGMSADVIRAVEVRSCGPGRNIPLRPVIFVKETPPNIENNPRSSPRGFCVLVHFTPGPLHF
jgi:hypothetical protein